MCRALRSLSSGLYRAPRTIIDRGSPDTISGHTGPAQFLLPLSLLLSLPLSPFLSPPTALLVSLFLSLCLSAPFRPAVTRPSRPVDSERTRTTVYAHVSRPGQQQLLTIPRGTSMIPGRSVIGRPTMIPVLGNRKSRVCGGLVTPPGGFFRRFLLSYTTPYQRRRNGER